MGQVEPCIISFFLKSHLSNKLIIAPGGASLNLASNGYISMFPKLKKFKPSLTSLSLFNRLHVLDSFGLAEALFSRGIAAPVELVSYRTNEKLLVESDISLRVAEKSGFPFAGVKRSVFLQ